MYFTQHFTFLITFLGLFLCAVLNCVSIDYSQHFLHSPVLQKNIHQHFLLPQGPNAMREKTLLPTEGLLKNINISVGIFPAFHVLALEVFLAKVVRCQRYIWVIERNKSTDYTLL